MARGSKDAYTGKQKRQAMHIEKGYEARGLSEDEAERRAWATVNKTSGGGKKSGAGRKKKVGGKKKGVSKKTAAGGRKAASEKTRRIDNKMGEKGVASKRKAAGGRKATSITTEKESPALQKRRSRKKKA